MVNPVVRIQKKLDNAQTIKKRLKILAESEVYVGIPQEESSRADGTINNAERLWVLSHGVRKKSMRDAMQPNLDAGMKYSAAHSLYLQTYGSPLWHIPPRPLLEPAIEDRKEIIGGKLKDAAKAAVQGDTFGAEKALNEAGQAGQNAAVEWFDNPKNNWPPNSPKTIAKKGSDSPLVDTGNMKKAITYVIDRKGLDTHV